MMPMLHRSVCVQVTSLWVVLALTGVASAQQESAAAAMPQPEPRRGPIEVTVRGDQPKSPVFSQGRPWAATRFWVLDPGEQEAEVWYSSRINHNGVKGDSPHLLQVEYMAGVTPRVQLDVYFNYKFEGDKSQIEGAQIEGRFALARRYGEIWGNPALYLEWHPKTRGPNRAEARLLLGGEIFRPDLFGAINPFFEQNLDEEADGKFVSDREIGFTAALSYALLPGRLSLGAEIKAAADQQDEIDYKAVVKMGPAVWLSLFDGFLRVTYTGLFGLTSRSDAYNPIVILGIHP